MAKADGGAAGMRGGRDRVRAASPFRAPAGRAVQPWRERGMKLIGLVGNCKTAPEDYPDSVPERLCDVCLVPPYKTGELRAVFTRLYEQMRGQPAPPPLKSASAVEDLEEAD